MDLHEQHRLILAGLFNDLRREAYLHSQSDEATAFHVTDYYTGSTWRTISELVIVGTSLYEQVPFPDTKTRLLDPREKPIMWPDWCVDQATAVIPLHEVRISLLKEIEHRAYMTFRKVLDVTKYPPIVSRGSDHTRLSYFEEADAVLAQALMESA